MSFMEEAVNRSIPIWDRCVRTPFIREMKDGMLPLEKFQNYLIQDSIYLKHYARLYGKAIYHADTFHEIQFFYSILNLVTESENTVRLNYLKQFGMTDEDIELVTPKPANQSYIDFLLAAAERGDVCAILMAGLPCMLSYSYIFRKSAADPAAIHSEYWDFIQDYAEQNYLEDCRRWAAYADQKCSVRSSQDRKELAAVFERASLLELAFWEMAYQEPGGRM